MPPFNGCLAKVLRNWILLGPALLMESQSFAQAIYVNHAATGANDGTSWDDAFTSLHEGLNAVTESRSTLYVATGVYRPSDAADGYRRTRSFEITRRVTIFGGYAKAADGTWNRDVDGTPTLLDGDLRGDDGPNFANRSDNSIHVIHKQIGDFLGRNVLSGLHIRGGNADGLAGTSEGGGGLFEYDYTQLVDCRIYDNQAVWRGGGLSQGDGYPLLCTRCVFFGNDAPYGSAYAAGSIVLESCVFTGNGGLSQGNAVFTSWEVSTTSIMGCTFVGNPGGALQVANRAVVLSSILWNNGPQPIETARSISVIYSDIQGGYAGEGNIDADPRFVDAPGPDGVAGTLDDNFRLAADSPCINAGKAWEERYVLHCRAEMGAFESHDFPDCDSSGVSDDCEIRDDPAMDADGDGRLDRCDSPPPNSNENANDNGGEPPPGSNENNNGSDPPTSGYDDGKPPAGENGGSDQPTADDDGLNPGLFAPCSSVVALISALLFALHLDYARNRRRNRPSTR